MSEPLGLLELEVSDSMLTYPALIRVSPWLNVLTLLLLGILFFLSVAYRMELKFFCLAQHPFYISLTSIPSVDSMTQPPIHSWSLLSKAPFYSNALDHLLCLPSPYPSRNLLAFEAYSKVVSPGMPFPTSSSKVSLFFLSYMYNFGYTFQNIVHYYDCVCPMLPASLCSPQRYESRIIHSAFIHSLIQSFFPAFTPLLAHSRYP